MKELYDLLGVPENASRKEIEETWKQKAFELHPDRQPPELRDEYTKIFQELSEAYRILTDPIERAKYIQNKDRAKEFEGIEKILGANSTFRGEKFSGKLCIKPTTLEYTLRFPDTTYHGFINWQDLFPNLYENLQHGYKMPYQLNTLFGVILRERRVNPQITGDEFAYSNTLKITPELLRKIELLRSTRYECIRQAEQTRHRFELWKNPIPNHGNQRSQEEGDEKYKPLDIIA